jgi:hypothetical protein
MGWYTCTSRGGSRLKSNLEFREVEDVDSEYSVFTSPGPDPDPDPVPFHLNPDPFPDDAFQVFDGRGDSGSDGNLRGLALGRVMSSLADIARGSEKPGTPALCTNPGPPSTRASNEYKSYG